MTNTDFDKPTDIFLNPFCIMLYVSMIVLLCICLCIKFKLKRSTVNIFYYKYKVLTFLHSSSSVLQGHRVLTESRIPLKSVLGA